MCVIERYQGKPTIKYNGTSALTSVCPMLFNGGKQTPLLNQYLLHYPFPGREGSGHGPGFGHHTFGSGRKQSAGAGAFS